MTYMYDNIIGGGFINCYITTMDINAPSKLFLEQF